MPGYTTRQVAEIVGLTCPQVRAYARQGLLRPGREGTQYRFTFQDIVLLRTARELREKSVPARRIHGALMRLREQLTGGRPLSAVRISAVGTRVVVRDEDTVWEPETGQVTFDFSMGEMAAGVEPLLAEIGPSEQPPGSLPDGSGTEGSGTETPASTDALFEEALELESTSLAAARAAYLRVLDADPAHAEALLNLGRLVHEDGDAAAAEGYYRRALGVKPVSALAAFNLGVALEDLERAGEAEAAYELALEADPDHPEAHYNLAGLLEARGEMPAALRHLAAYRRLRSG